LPRKLHGIAHNRALLSVLATLIIFTLLLFPLPIGAVTVTVSNLDGQSITQDQSFPFYIDMNIEAEHVPVDTIRISVTGPTSFTYDFSLSGGNQLYLGLEVPSAIINGTVFSYGYGYGYGDYQGYGYGYFPSTLPYGYGYGYYPTGYGYGFTGPQTLRWVATFLNTASLPTGEYKLRVQIRSNGVWWGGAPTEVTFYIVAPPVEVLPDLTPAAMEVTPSEPIAGETCNVEVTIQNIGREDTGSFAARLTVDSMEVQTVIVNGLAVDESTIATFSWTPQEQGTYELTATVDPTNLVIELSEDNNIISTTVVVQPMPLPDLTAEFTDLPESFLAGTNYDITVLVTNVGESAVGAFDVDLRANGVLVNSVEVSGLSAGTSTTVSFAWTPVTAGDYTLAAAVDPENVIVEANETNNVVTASVNVTMVPWYVDWWPIIAGAIIIVLILVLLMLQKMKKLTFMKGINLQWVHSLAFLR
jgi:hypothetical protein